MLREKFIHQEALTLSKHKKCIFLSILLTCSALVIFYYLKVFCRREDVQYISLKTDSISFSRNIKDKIYPCPKRHKIAYIWTYGEMPDVYKDFVNRCKDNLIILNQTDFDKYWKMWNQKYPEHEIKSPEKLRFNTRNDFLKRLYLYFEGGIYSDFDTQINEECWQDLVTQKIIFTNSWGPYGTYSLPEENFMKVLRPYHPDLKQWIIELTYETRWMGNRWDRCRWQQCLILFCQSHNYDNSWVDLENK